MGYGSMIYYCLTGLWFMNVHEYGVWLGVFWTYTIISGHGWQNEMLFDQGSFKVDTINFHSTRSLTWKRIIIFVLKIGRKQLRLRFVHLCIFALKTKRDIITTGDFFVSRWQYTFSQKYNFLIQVSSFFTVQFKMAKIKKMKKMENFRKVFLKKSFQKSFKKNFIKKCKKSKKFSKTKLEKC